VAVLDWELAHLGNPIEDLGWFCVRSWRFGSPHCAGGFGSVEELLAGYASVDGVEVGMDELRWWEVFGNLRWAVMTIVQAARHWTGASPSLELAMVGRRTCEPTYDLLRLIKEAGE
jgi:aminoglycoside phosphotransferase (APT) family kinase protein